MALDLAPQAPLQCPADLAPRGACCRGPGVPPEVTRLATPARPHYAIRHLFACLCLVAVSFAAALTGPTREEVLQRLAGDARVEDFSEASAPGISIADKDLSQTSWRNADLRGVVFQRVRLDSAILAGASLRGAVLDDVSLADADLTGADLSGARIRLANLAGARMDDTQILGTSFQLVLLSPNGGTHGEALRLALEKACGQTFTRAWVSGLSGEAFAFVYNTEDAGFWPGTPFTASPFEAAAQALGLGVRTRLDVGAERFLLGGEELPPGVHVLPMEYDQTGLWMLRNMPLWGVVASRHADEQRHTYLSLTLPPFGERTMREAELMAGWTGPWHTLQPAGAMNVRARRPLISFTPPDAIATVATQAGVALRRVAPMVGEKRTYGPLVPGAAGLTRLAADLRAVAQSGDAEQGKALALWEQFPRQCLLGARTEACRFLEEALPALGPDREGYTREALALYQGEVQALRELWPSLAAGLGGDTATLVANYTRAADLVAKLAADERAAAQLLAQAAGE